jgi:hypothetical protein
MDLLPALAVCFRALAFPERGAVGPAGGMRGGFLRGGLGQQMPQVPAVPALDGVRQRRADGLAACPGPVAGDDLDAGVLAEPVLDDIGGAAFQDVDAPAGLGVDEDGRVDQAPPQGKIVNPQHAGHFQGGQGDPEQDPQRGLPGDADAQRRQQPGSRTPG